METKKVSVIIPIYNIEDYLDDCIKSIIKQSYKNLEIILVDDGSTDRSGDIIDEWAGKDYRIKAFHKNNEGQAKARNYGFDQSTGDYIGYVDGDDYIAETYFKKLVDGIEKNDAEMCGCRFYRDKVDESGFVYPNPDESYRFCLSPDEFMERLFNDFGVFCMACGKLYKRCVVVKNMFPSARIAEDAQIMRELAYRCRRIAYIPDALYMYRVRRGSTQTSSRNYTLKDQQERVKWVEDDIAYYKGVHNDRLQAIAEKAFCYSINNEWKFFDKECKMHYRHLYYKALRHMLIHEGNSFGAKCKYLLYGVVMLFC